MDGPKDHPYRKIAQHMRRHSQESSGVRILGLTASISYAVTESAIKKSIGQLCNELQITTIGGFHLHLLVFPIVYQFSLRIGVLDHSSFAND